MNGWLHNLVAFFSSLFNGTSKAASSPRGVSVAGTQSTNVFPDKPVERDVVSVDNPGHMQSSEAEYFLLSLISRTPPCDLQAQDSKEQALIHVLQEKLRTNSFEIPLLPDAAVRIQGLLNNPKVNTDDFIDIFKNDPALSASLIKMANSAYFGGNFPVHDLYLAITRVGFNQIQGLVMMTWLRSRVLNEDVQNEVGWVTDLSLRMAAVCRHLAADFSMKAGDAFTMGLLRHVEYFVVLGAVSDYVTEQKDSKISKELLIAAIWHLGPAVREQIVRKWGLELLELSELAPLADDDHHEHPPDIGTQLDALQRILIEKLCGGTPVLAIPGIRPEALRRAVEAVLQTRQSDFQ